MNRFLVKGYARNLDTDVYDQFKIVCDIKLAQAYMLIAAAQGENDPVQVYSIEPIW